MASSINPCYNINVDKKKSSKIGARIGTALLALVIFAFGYLFGHANLQLDERYIPRLVNTELGQPSDIDFGLFWEVYDELSSSYLREFDNESVLYGAISGMVNSLDDPYSAFLTPEQSTAFQEDLSGTLQGIGAEIGRQNGLPTIIAPLEGSPAQKAGLVSGDAILAVDGQYTENLSIDEVVLLIRGEEGTEVTLSILGAGDQEAHDVTITREEIDIEDVTWEKDGDTAVIRIRQFGDSSLKQFDAVAKEVKESGVSKIIVDLRNNPGGLLDQSVDIVGYFLPKGTVVVKEQPKEGSIEEWKVENDPMFESEKLVVLVNGGSASASEIFAGAIQDASRGKVVGETTYGKGTVQVYMNLDLGSALKLTVAQWLTPKGRVIDKNGITPDILSEMSEEDSKSGEDPQMDTAKSEINKM